MKTLLATLSFIVATIATQSTVAQSDAANRILGEWIPGHGEARVKISIENDVLTGTIVWLKEPNDKITGEPRKNINNRDKALREKPLMGLRIVDGFKYQDQNVWQDGTVYDPESGKTYCGRITLINDNELRLRGNICGFSMLGRNDIWTRYQEP